MNWYDINWAICHKTVKNAQIEIAAAYKNNKIDLVEMYQNDLVNSFAACACAVKLVTSNKGCKTPGVDGRLYSTPQQKILLVEKLHAGFEN